MTHFSHDNDMSCYFSGEKLYGDDFSKEQLAKWYDEEAEGYSGLVNQSPTDYSYVYHALNEMHGYRYENLPQGCSALGVGTAYCEEFLPIISKLAHITALDPSEHFATKELKGIPVSHVRPSIEGDMPFPNDSFDVITCFGALHHIANVSTVLKECHRVLKPGGVMFCREPIVSMGDWRILRKGLTKNERGIPVTLFIQTVEKCGFHLSRKVLFDFGPLGKLMSMFGMAIFSHKSTTMLDYILSQLFAFNIKYHRTGTLEKFGPASIFLILHK